MPTTSVRASRRARPHLRRYTKRPRGTFVAAASSLAAIRLGVDSLENHGFEVVGYIQNPRSWGPFRYDIVYRNKRP